MGLAAMNDPQLNIEKATKYQVLTDETAMLGMVMQKDNTSGELKKIDTIQFGRKTVKTNEPELPVLPPWRPRFKPGPQPRYNKLPIMSFSDPTVAKATTTTPNATVKSDDKYDTLIDAQHTSGYWKKSAEKELKKFFENSLIEDDAVEAGLASVTDKKKAYLTLVALHIL